LIYGLAASQRFARWPLSNTQKPFRRSRVA